MDLGSINQKKNGKRSSHLDTLKILEDERIQRQAANEKNHTSTVWIDWIEIPTSNHGGNEISVCPIEIDVWTSIFKFKCIFLVYIFVVHLIGLVFIV